MNGDFAALGFKPQFRGPVQRAHGLDYTVRASVTTNITVNLAIVSYTSNRPQHDLGNHLRLRSIYL